MTQDVPREGWKVFFDDLSKRRFEWRTKVEVMGSDIGDQILSERLPLSGITVEENKGTPFIEIIVGFDEDNHQTHTIVNPEKIRYQSDTGNASGVVEIEESNGTRTMVYIIEPLPFQIGRQQPHGIARSG